MQTTLLAIILAFFLDMIIGDPHNPYHPICIIGKIISYFISLYDKLKIKNLKFQFLYGMFMNIFIIMIVFFSTLSIVVFLYKINFLLGFLFEIIFAYFIIAPKCLYLESMKVYKALQSKDVEKARLNLSYIVGRDTQNLQEDDIIKATVETVSENLCDGVIAPLFYLAIGGVPLGMLYKAVNTLDSMVGYKNEKFLYFGKFSARIDDILNFIPARLSAILMLISTLILKLNFKNALKIYIRDRYKHSSPNSAHTEAVCAGALGILLGGDSYYKGILVKKDTIGNFINKPINQDIIRANSLMYLSSAIFIIILALILFL